MTDNQFDRICTEYLEQLRDALRELPLADREQIIDQVSEHIASARSTLAEENEAAVRNILERLGTPRRSPLPPVSKISRQRRSAIADGRLWEEQSLSWRSSQGWVWLRSLAPSAKILHLQ